MQLTMVVVGLMLRLNGAAAAGGGGGGKGGEVTGVLLTLASALCFSLMNIMYALAVSPIPPPSHKFRN
jgi:hypothetical protein